MYLIEDLAGCSILIGRNFTEDSTLMYTRVGNTLKFSAVSSDQVALIECSLFKTASTEYITSLEELFARYSKVIAKDMTTLGQTSSVELDIELITNKPICQHPYRMSESQKAAIYKKYC